MKQNIIITLLILTVLFSTGCKKFLERPPQGQMTEDEALKTEQDLINLANGLNTYTGDGDFFGGRYQLLNSLFADQFNGDKFTGDYAEIYKRQNSFFGGTRDDFYKKAYKIINRANVILRRLDLATTQKNNLEGTA